MIKVVINEKDGIEAEKSGYDPVDTSIARALNVRPSEIEYVGNCVEIYKDDKLSRSFLVSSEDLELMKQTRDAWDYEDLSGLDLQSLNIRFELKKHKG